MSKKTIYDLSKELHHAPSTISKALNNLPGVNESTRKKIIEYAKENGYYANPTARALKSKKSYTIGILYSEESNVGLEHPFFSMILQSAKNYFENNGYDLIFINPKANDYQGYKQFCILRNIAGVFIVSASANDKLLKELLESDELKVVATDYINDDVSSVLSDNTQAITSLIEYYKKCGYKTAGILTTKNKVRSFKERYDTYITKCKENNIIVNEKDIICADDYLVENAFINVDKYLAKNKPPEVIFASSDLFALGCIKALIKNNYKVPEDVSVFGFDDIELASYFTPSISTLKQNAKEIGEKAAQMLISKLNNIPQENKIIRVPVELKIRSSSK